MVRAPGLAQGSEDIALYDPVTVVAEFSKELMIVVSTVGETGPLVVSVTEERFLALGTGEVLHVPVLPQGGHHPLLYRPPAGSTYRDVHLVVAPETVQRVHLVSSEAGPGVDLPGGAGELHPAARAVEVVRVVSLSLAVSYSNKSYNIDGKVRSLNNFQ